jgi:hypothetical protein
MVLPCVVYLWFSPPTKHAAQLHLAFILLQSMHANMLTELDSENEHPLIQHTLYVCMYTCSSQGQPTISTPRVCMPHASCMCTHKNARAQNLLYNPVRQTEICICMHACMHEHKHIHHTHKGNRYT